MLSKSKRQGQKRSSDFLDNFGATTTNEQTGNE